MWLTFCLAVLILVLFLYITGTFLFRAAGLPETQALALAPALSITLTILLGLICYGAGVKMSGFVACGAALIICVLALPRLAKRKQKWTVEDKYTTRENFRSSNLAILLFCIVFNCAIAFFYFILPLDGPSSIVQTYDNVFHYNVIQSLIDSGSWSLLSIDAYLNQQSLSIDPFPGAGFYPAAWHFLAAIPASMLGSAGALGANCAIFVLIAIVFPSGIFLLLETIFPENKKLLWLGSLCPLVCTAFPWVLIDEWPLFPNMASFCLLPIAICAFVLGFEKWRTSNGDVGHRIKQTLIYWVALLLSLIALGCTQPNSCFSLVVVLAPYCLWTLLRSARKKGAVATAVTAFAAPACFLLLALAFYYICVPRVATLAVTVFYYWAPIQSHSEALLAIADLSFTSSNGQPVQVALLIVGCVFLVTKERRSSWLVLAFACSAFIYFVAATEDNTMLKHFIAGFWYTDPYRVAGLAGLTAIPLIAIGLYTIAAAIERATRTLRKKSNLSSYNGLLATVIAICFTMVAFVPTSPCAYALAGIKNTATDMNLNGRAPLDSEEINFITSEIKESDSSGVIINQPFDGSILAYGALDLDIYYRDISGYGNDTETPDSKLIRTKLNKISTNTEVQKAVDSIGAKYVLLLKPSFVADGLTYPTYHEEEWYGINSINEDTPGFTLIAQEDGNKLYRINY